MSANELAAALEARQIRLPAGAVIPDGSTMFNCCDAFLIIARPDMPPLYLEPFSDCFKEMQPCGVEVESGLTTDGHPPSLRAMAGQADKHG